MQASTPLRTASPVQSAGKRKCGLPIVGLVVLLIAAAGIGWFGIRNSDEDPSTAEQLYGTWQDVTPSLLGYYLVFDEEGIVDTYFDRPTDPRPNQWGTYVLNGDILTMTDAPDAPFCKGAVSVFTVSFSQDGDEAYFDFTSDSCVGTIRGTDWTLARQSP